jgi:hypothetical protein
MLDAAAVNETAEARRVLEIIRRCIDPGFRAIDRTGSTTSDNDPFAPNAFSARRLRALAANDDLRLAEGQINFLEGDSDTAWEVAGQFLTWYDRVLFPRRSVFPAEQWEYLESLQFAARILQLQDTIVKERTPTTMRLLDTVERDGYAEHITVRALRFLVGKFRQPPLSGPSIEVREAALLDESRDNPALARIIADQAEKVFRKHEEALRWMEHRRSIKEVPLDALEVSALARLYYRLGRWDDLEAFLPEMEGARGTPDVRLYVRRQMDLYREEITRLRGAGGGGQP